jgi:hypothetical protein
MKKKKILYGLMFLLIGIESFIHVTITSRQVKALDNTEGLSKQVQVYQANSQKPIKVQENYQKSDYEDFHQAVVSLNIIKALIVVSGCLFTAVVSLTGETLVKTIIYQFKDVLLEIMSNQKYFDNISSEEVLRITQEMKRTRKELNATRLSMFKEYEGDHTVFLEVSSDGKYSLARESPINKHFFDYAVLPMINDNQKYFYCTNNETCETWLAERGTGRFAIHLFFYKNTFAGFLLAEWNKLMLFNSIFKYQQNTDYYESKLEDLAAIINEAIKDKK